jgi:hypothetical protein
MTYDLTNLYFPVWIIAFSNPIWIYKPNSNSLGITDITGTPIFNNSFSKIRTIGDTVLEGYYKNGKYCLYDAIALAEYTSLKASNRYQDRRKLLMSIVARLGDYNTFCDAFTYFCQDPKEVKWAYYDCLQKGYLGVKVMDNFGLYLYGSEDKHNFLMVPK